jgi:hypothetical protein
MSGALDAFVVRGEDARQHLLANEREISKDVAKTGKRIKSGPLDSFLVPNKIL